MSTENYILYKTLYDPIQYKEVVALLKQEGIKFKADDKSGQLNYRMPSSTYSEIDLSILEQDYERADNLLSKFSQ